MSITENSSGGSSPPHRPVLLTPAARAHRLAELRAALRDAAPAFQARAAAERGTQA